jgi:hypothetical protein
MNSIASCFLFATLYLTLKHKKERSNLFTFPLKSIKYQLANL